jgi:Mn2+/Fe2+ NRAMP family transporter
MTFIIAIALLAVLAALASAGVFMLRKDKAGEADPQARDKRMARALAVRVGLSIALFLFILFSWHMGWIEPKGIPTGR